MTQKDSSLELLRYGAHIISWKTNDSVENIFLSSLSPLDGSAAIRGGIPIVFPQFATPLPPSTSGLPMHGFARISMWHIDSYSVNSTDIEVVMNMTESDMPGNLVSQWPYSFVLKYTVTLGLKGKLATSVYILNRTPSTTMTFDILLHNYFTVSNISNVYVEGLSGKTFVDKNNAYNVSVDTAKHHTISSPTNLIYLTNTNESSTSSTRLIDNTSNCSSSTLTIDREGLGNNVVVWNPWTAPTSSLTPTMYKSFLAIESGNIGYILPVAGSGVSLFYGQSFSGRQIFSKIIADNCHRQ